MASTIRSTTPPITRIIAGSTLSPVSPLGDYELRVDGAGRTVRAILRLIAVERSEGNFELQLN